MAKKEGDIYSSLLKENFIGIPVTLIKKECFEKAGLFDEKLPALEDWELWIRISKYYQFKYIAEPLAISYCQPDSISINKGTLIAAYKLILKKHFEEVKKDKRVLAKYYFHIGHLVCSNKEIRQGRSYLMKAMKTYPLNIEFSIAAFTSLFGQNSYVKITKCYRYFRR